MIDFQYINTHKISTEDISNWLKDVTTKEGKEIGELVYVFCNDDYLLEVSLCKSDSFSLSFYLSRATCCASSMAC